MPCIRPCYIRYLHLLTMEMYCGLSTHRKVNNTKKKNKTKKLAWQFNKEYFRVQKNLYLPVQTAWSSTLYQLTRVGTPFSPRTILGCLYTLSSAWSWTSPYFTWPNIGLFSLTFSTGDQSSFILDSLCSLVFLPGNFKKYVVRWNVCMSVFDVEVVAEIWIDSFIPTFYLRSKVFLTFPQIFSIGTSWLCLMVAVVIGLIPVVVVLTILTHLQSYTRLKLRRHAHETKELSIDSNITAESVMSGTPLLSSRSKEVPKDWEF